MSRQQISTVAPLATATHEPCYLQIEVKESEDFSRRARDLFDAIAHRAEVLAAQRGREHGRELDDWFNAEAEILEPVAVATEDTERGYTVRAWVPAIHAGQLGVWVCGQTLAVVGSSEGKRGYTESGALCSEEDYRKAFCSIDLSTEADVSKATALLEKGVLSIAIPKRTASEPPACGA
jgi:HSP20 family molecular chaperone IbpA